MPMRVPSGSSRMPVDVERLVVLADLIRLGHVGIEVVLAVERARLDGAVERQADAHRQLDRLPVEHRQRTGKTEGDRVDVGVRLVAEPVGTGREQLRHRGQLDVHLETDDELPIARETVAPAHSRSLMTAPFRVPQRL